MNSPSDREIRSDLMVDGLRVAVFESGGGAGTEATSSSRETCVLLHGYPQDHRCWRHVAASLARTHRVIAVDWFGWGLSERSLVAAHTYDAEVARLRLLLDALELGRVNVFAHDYGAFLALGFAIRNPGRLLRLALLNSRVHSTFPTLPYLQFATFSSLGRVPGLRAAFAALPLYGLHRRSLAPYVRNGSWSEEDVDRYIGWMRTRPGRRWLAHFFAHYEVRVRAELRAGCGRIEVPAAVIWGDRDPFCPFAIAEDLATRLPNASLVRVGGADHYVMEERPAEVIAALEGLLAQAV